MPRFFVKNNDISDGVVVISGEDAHHISYSLRMAKGDAVTVCDMARNEYSCVIEDFYPDSVSLRVISSKPSENEPPYEITLYQAMPKGDKFDTIIQKSVETGVSRIVPFYSERCIAKPRDSSADRKNDRRNKIAEEAGKQCGRARIVSVEPPTDFKTAVREAAKASLPLFFYEGDGVTSLKEILRSRSEKINDISIIIGSEGGFSADEAQFAASSGMICAGLGRRILRCETAPVFALSALAYEFEL